MPGLDNIPDQPLEEDQKRVYVAGPYTHGKWENNIRKVIEAGQKLYEAGHYPLLPHTHTYPWSLFYDNQWIEIDLVWLEVCDAIIRLPGKSNGADTEVEYAKENGIKVYHSVDHFLEEVGHAS